MMQMFCFDKQWIIHIPVLLHFFLDCNLSSHLLPSSFSFKIPHRENGSAVLQQISFSKILLIILLAIWPLSVQWLINNPLSSCISLLSRTLRQTHTHDTCLGRKTKYYNNRGYVKWKSECICNWVYLWREIGIKS